MTQSINDRLGPGGLENVAILSTVNGNTVLLDAQGAVAFRSVGSYAWVNRPDATLNLGVVIRITDIGGSAGSRWISDGTYWKPESGRVVLGKGSTSLACVDVSGTQETLATVLVPQYAMGAEGRIVIRTSWNHTGNNAAKEVRHNFGAFLVMAVSEAANANPRSARFESQIQNRNNTAAQVASNASNNATDGAYVGVALATGTVNTQADVNVTISCSRANAGDTATLESYLVELIVP